MTNQPSSLNQPQLRQLAALAGVAIPEADIEPLLAVVANQLAAIQLLDQINVQDIEPDLHFDPRWESPK